MMTFCIPVKIMQKYREKATKKKTARLNLQVAAVRDMSRDRHSHCSHMFVYNLVTQLSFGPVP